MKLRVGSRKSDLAQIQSRLVAGALRAVAPDIGIEFVFKDVGVDLDLGISLVDAEARGLFTKDLSEDLVRGKIDLVVHSWKDLPTAGHAQTFVAATLEREDPRDVVFVKETALKKTVLTFLSSSPRREVNLGAFMQEYVFTNDSPIPRELRFTAIRGNLPTRLRQFMSGGDDALVLALAAVKRLRQYGNADSRAALEATLAACKVVVVPVLENPPAPAQGALAVEIRRDNSAVIALLEKINHAATFRDVLGERARLEDFGGGCHLALGIFQRTTSVGTLRVEKGLTPEGARLSLQDWIPTRGLPPTPAAKFFDASSLNLFERRSLNIPMPVTASGHFFLISKTEALPESWAVQPNDILWAAGLKTWKKLRRRGLWVTGCQEGLGETFFALPLELWPDVRPLKLSHTDAPEKLLPLWATYELVRNRLPLPDLQGFDMIYWPSGSVFRACVEAQPALLSKKHCCGLGNTYDELLKEIPPERLFALASSPG